MTTNGAITTMYMRTTTIGLLLTLGGLGTTGCGLKPLEPGSDHPPASTQTPGQPTAGTCGAINQVCCGGGTCNNGAVCTANMCVAVTAIPAAPAPVVCGGTNQPCCNGTACGAGNTCANGTCTAAQPTGACGGFGQVCCAGNVCPNGVGLACGSNGLCAAANSLPTTPPSTAPTLPTSTPCWTNDWRLGTQQNGGPCVPIPIMNAPNPNGPRFASANQVGTFVNTMNASEFCAGMTHTVRAELNTNGPECMRFPNGQVYCSHDAKGRPVYWARTSGRLVDVDNACEGETADNHVYVMFTPNFLRRAQDPRANVREIACEIERSLGVPSDVATSFASALRERSFQLHTQPSGEVPGLVTPPGTI